MFDLKKRDWRSKIDGSMIQAQSVVFRSFGDWKGGPEALLRTA